jgi:transposase InsO family protein
MTHKEQQILSNKWLLVIKEYDLVKKKQSKHFKSVNEICDVFSVNRKDIRNYYMRWCQSGGDPESLLPKKRGPKPGQLKILTKEEERAIVKIHRKLDANEFEIHHLIEGKFRVHPSVSTIYRTLKRYPLNKKRKAAIKRYERKYPGELLHADTYSLAKTIMFNRKKYYLFGAIDDCTRLCHVEIIEKQTAQQATQAFFKAFKWFNAHGIQPEEVMTDNGQEFTAFTSQKAKDKHFFESMLNIFGVKHLYTKPYKPQTNGKIERFWRILHNECLLAINNTLSFDEFEAELNGFLYRYNYQRRHSALNYNTPLDKLKTIANLLPEL